MGSPADKKTGSNLMGWRVSCKIFESYFFHSVPVVQETEEIRCRGTGTVETSKGQAQQSASSVNDPCSSLIGVVPGRGSDPAGPHWGCLGPEEAPADPAVR